MQTIFLHIGDAKTGTSSIQVFHRDNAEALAALGFHVPKLGRGPHGAHHGLTCTLAGQPSDCAASEREIIREISEAPAESVLISSEMLAAVLAKRETAERLLGNLGSTGAEVVLVMYVRNQTQRLNSHYSQQVKSFRHRGDFREYVADVLARRGSGYARWLDIARRHGLELRARPFSEQVRRDGVVHDYLETVGCQCPDSLVVPPRVNESAGPFTVEAALRLQDWAVERFSEWTLNQADMSKHSLAEAVRTLGMEEPAYCGLDDNLARQVEAAFKDSNDRFAQCMWGRDWHSVFGADVGGSFEPNDYRYAGVPAAMRQPLEAIEARMRDEIGTILEQPRLPA